MPNRAHHNSTPWSVLKPGQHLAALLAVAAMTIGSSAFAKDTSTPRASPSADASVVPYTNLSTLHVKPSQLSTFEEALRRNANAARHERGNLSFSVFQAVGEPDTLYVLEQWKDESAYRAHLTQPALIAMHSIAKTALDGEISHMRIVSTTGDAGLQPATIARADLNSDVLVFLSVKSDQTRRFHTDVAAVAPTFRAAPGNVAFDVYQDVGDPEHVVQLERWTTQASHAANMTRPVIRQIRAGYAVTLAKPMTDGRVVVRDITDDPHREMGRRNVS